MTKKEFVNLALQAIAGNRKVVFFPTPESETQRYRSKKIETTRQPAQELGRQVPEWAK